MTGTNMTEWKYIWLCIYSGSVGKESAYNAGDLDLILGLGRSPGEGNGNSLQYSFLENFMDRGSWRLQSTVLQESDTTEHTFTMFEWSPQSCTPPTPRTQQIGRKECCLRPMRPGAMVRGCLPRGAGVTGAPATVSGSKQEGLRNETPPSLLPPFPLMLVLPTGWTQSESREREEGRDWSGVGVASRKMQGCTWSHHPGSFMTYKLPLSLGLSFVHHSSLLQSYRI